MLLLWWRHLPPSDKGASPKVVAITLRSGGPEDFEAALAVVRAADTARLAGHDAPAVVGERMRAHLESPDSFLTVAEVGGQVVGMALGMQGLSDDGAGPPIEGLCHVGAVFVSPEHWGAGIGGRLVDEILEEARTQGYTRAQLWTHSDNARAQRLYEHRGFRHTGRRKEADHGEMIIHYAKRIAED